MFTNYVQECDCGVLIYYECTFKLCTKNCF